MAATATAATLSTRLYSYPPFWTKNPFGPWTLAIATTIVATTNRPASGVSNPSRNRNPAASSPPTASAAQTRAGRNPRLPTKPVAPAKPGPPNAPNAFCAPWPRNTAPRASRSARTPRSNIAHLRNNVSNSRYLTLNHFGNSFPAHGVPGGDDETIAEPCGRAATVVGRPRPGVRRRRTSLAGEHRALPAGHDGVRGAGSAVPQGRAAGVRSATTHPGRIVEHDLRGGQAREARAGAATAQRHRPPRRPAGAHPRGASTHPTHLSAARGRHAACRRGAPAARAGPGDPVAARARPGRGRAARGQRGVLSYKPCRKRRTRVR